MRDFAAVEWRRAQRSLAAAELVSAVDPSSAASRAYYAAFHAATALFALRGILFRKHSAVRAAVHRDLVRDGHWPAELGQAFDSLLELRETGDYGELAEVSGEDAALAVDRAKKILEAVRRMCPELAEGE